MTRHAAFPSVAPAPMPSVVCVQWTALIARGDLGRSSNALDLEPETADGPTTFGGIRPDRPSPLRRIELSVRLEPVAGSPDRVLFAAEMTEDGQRRTLDPAGILPGSVAIVGEHVHFVANDPNPPAGDDGAREPLLMVVLGASGDASLVRGRIGRLAGLAAGSLGRARVSTARGPLPR
jgi:hypothetical protein